MERLCARTADFEEVNLLADNIRCNEDTKIHVNSDLRIKRRVDRKSVASSGNYKLIFVNNNCNRNNINNNKNKMKKYKAD